jgi:predicted NUDIX family NTP pyrophosphohydrolase
MQVDDQTGFPSRFLSYDSAMRKVSAGLLMYHHRDGKLHVLLVHPGGPYFHRKDDGHWSIPKGGVNEGEELLAAAHREFEEETGFVATGELLPLHHIKLKSGKKVHAWAVQGKVDTKKLKSLKYKMEWPPHSGKEQEFPEIDRGEFFDAATAKRKLNPAQAPLVEQLEKLLEKAQERSR